MKIVYSFIAAALLISTGVMFTLVKKGAALRPMGVITPAEIGVSSELMGKSIGLRLFPDFQTSKNVIWYLDITEEPYSSVPESTLLNYQSNFKPKLVDLRIDPAASCADGCWYIQSPNTPLTAELQQKIKTEPSLEIYIQKFQRDEDVPELCESEKILDAQCVRPVSVREVRKKIKTPVAHFFMRRYMDSQFYLFVEKM